MNSFSLVAVGNLARDPEPGEKGDKVYTRFCLVGSDYAGKDDDGNPREAVTSVWFVAFDGIAEALARNCHKGDQLIVNAMIRADQWIDKEGEKRYGHDFIVQGFRFGAPGRIKREQLAARQHDEARALETEI
jgi:single-strand DNA-binding protein